MLEDVENVQQSQQHYCINTNIAIFLAKVIELVPFD